MSSYYEVNKGDYLVSTDPALLDLETIYHYLSNESYWALNIPMSIVENSIRNSLPFGVYLDGQQIGFARLVTDKATFAYLADVYILQAHRGKGLSKWLITVIQDHPELQNLRRWMLATRDAHGLYEQSGWSVLDENTRKRFMQRHNKDVYKAG